MICGSAFESAARAFLPSPALIASSTADGGRVTRAALLVDRGLAGDLARRFLGRGRIGHA